MNKQKILSHKGEIKRLYKMTLDTLNNLEDIPYYEGYNLYSFLHITPSFDDDEFYNILNKVSQTYNYNLKK
jgi:hypothetical protein